MTANQDLAITFTATTDKGNSYEHISYVDPFPGRKGDEVLKESCGACRGTGVYEGPSGHKFYTPSVGGVDTGCFRCEGRGYTTRKVSSARHTAKRQAARANEARATAADFAAEAPARAAAELAADWDAALAEQARRDAKAKGFIAEVGTRLRKVSATVTLIRQYEATNYVTGNPEWRTIVKFNIDGKAAVWFTSYFSGEEGDVVTLSGTVKKHGSRDGEDQTTLTRCVYTAA